MRAPAYRGLQRWASRAATPHGCARGAHACAGGPAGAHVHEAPPGRRVATGRACGCVGRLVRISPPPAQHLKLPGAAWLRVRQAAAGAVVRAAAEAIRRCRRGMAAAERPARVVRGARMRLRGRGCRPGPAAARARSLGGRLGDGRGGRAGPGRGRPALGQRVQRRQGRVGRLLGVLVAKQPQRQRRGPAAAPRAQRPQRLPA